MKKMTEFDMALVIHGGSRMKHLKCGYEGPIEEFRGKKRGETLRCPNCGGIELFKVMDPDQKRLKRLFG